MALSPTYSLGDRLRDARESQALSQRELAVLLNVSERSIQAWEAGVVPRPLNRRHVLAWLAGAERSAL